MPTTTKGRPRKTATTTTSKKQVTKPKATKAPKAPKVTKPKTTKPLPPMQAPVEPPVLNTTLTPPKDRVGDNGALRTREQAGGENDQR